jgi:uncharacterized protein YozE (UPF0346 family)
MKFRGPKEVDDVTVLANRAFDDPAFPKQSTDFHEISDYLETHANFSFNLGKFDEIWDEYLENLKKF